MLISLAIVITAAIGISGCATTGMERSTKAKTSMTEMDSNIKLLLAQLDATRTSLRELVKPNNSDVEKAFQLFTKNVSKYEIKDIQAAVNRENASRAQ